ncbi:MAG: GNAT family N-acetyltransferase [Bacilli bacterium]|nr:GNAT family N-acetyltransferase [Bacilli bacterium]MDD3422571.1 GNAT family N-acetyltransferase [Bacilli bacterium]MDD4065512.1 GNAT family N-acetyltransferase [Bacilli bacterium]
MEQFKFIRPTKEYEQEARSFVYEMKAANSEFDGDAGLHKQIDHYDVWLLSIQNSLHSLPTEVRVPAETRFLVRLSDNKLVGIYNIRLVLNENLKNYGQHIGYCVRPSERRKGYNKIGLYCALKVCLERGMKEVGLDCDSKNPGSYKTMEALGGERVKIAHNIQGIETMYYYSIKPVQAIIKYHEIYEPLLFREPAPCGAVCNECEKYLATCRGCTTIEGKVFWTKYTNQAVCPFYDCAVNKNGLEHCGKCAKFPCHYFKSGDPNKSKEENDALLQLQIKNLSADKKN